MVDRLANEERQSSSTDSQQSSNSWNVSAWQLELQLTPFPRTSNLALIQKLIRIYGDNIHYLETRVTPDHGGMLVLQAACTFHQIRDIRWRNTIRSGYKVKEESRALSLEHINKLKRRKSRLEDAYRFRSQYVVFRDKMNALIADDTKFSL